MNEILAFWNAIISAVSTVARLAGALVGAKCICTNGLSTHPIVSPTDTFINISQKHGKKKRKDTCGYITVSICDGMRSTHRLWKIMGSSMRIRIYQQKAGAFQNTTCTRDFHSL